MNTTEQPERRSVGTRRREMLVVAWTAVVIILVALNLFTIRSLLPHVTVISLQTGLGRPGSQAYGALDISLDVRHESSWFGRDGAMTRTRWTLAAISEATLDQRQTTAVRIARARLTPAQRLALEPPPIGKLSADSLAKTMVIDCDGELQHETLSAESLTDWLISLFPDADPNRLAREAEGVIEMVDFMTEQTVLTAITNRAATPGWLPKGFQQGAGQDDITMDRRAWRPGIANVAGVVLAIWLVGTVVIVRLTRLSV